MSISDSVQFLEIAGTAKPEQLPAIAQQVAKLWKEHQHLLMVRNSVAVEAADIPVEHQAVRHLDLPASAFCVAGGPTVGTQ